MRSVLLLLVLGTALGEVYWWKFHNQDCGYDDVPGTCTGESVDGCKAKCLATSGCGGFNYPHGILKKTDCLKNKKASTVDLYVKESTPQPPPPPPPPAMPHLWPLPSNYTSGSSSVQVTPSAAFFKFTGATTPNTLTVAFERYGRLTFPHKIATSTAAGITSLSVSVHSTDESHPQIDTDESYTLTVTTSSASVSAANIYGAMRGLETFSQLVKFDFSALQYGIKDAPWTINDSPRFPHRGLMIDSSRHFEPLHTIRRVIESLPYAKLNVMHWHMSDTQSFPFESKTHPKLWEGSWNPQARYEQTDIADIVEYGRLHGVRVMVEFDMPGHAGSWCKGYPEVCPSPQCTQPLNVASNATWKLITDMLGECTGNKKSTPDHPSGLFPDDFIHLGGDEVNTACWSKSPPIMKWLNARGLTPDGGYEYFVKHTAATAIAQGRRPVQWVEVFEHFKDKLDKRTIVHVWKAKSEIVGVVKAGYNTLLSTGWYLDHLTDNWEAMYENEPTDGMTTDAEKKLVLGGQGEMWGETVDTSDIEQTVWPRLGSIAERLWSPQAAISNTAAAEPRLLSFRCLLNRRGVAAAPVKNPSARSAPPGAGNCLDQ